MSENVNSDKNNEIDLFKLINNLYNNLIEYLRHNIIYIIILIIIGLCLGYFISPAFKKYESRILISPNFGTVDYLYNEIDLINSKIKDNDTIYLKQIGFTKPITNISIEPVNSVYQFIQENDKNYDLIKLFAEDGDINKVAEDEKTSKNYRIHEIVIISKNSIIKEYNIDKLMFILNNNKHYNEVRKIISKNNEDRISSNIKTINQINTILEKFNNDLSNNKSPNLVYFNDTNQLNDLIDTKNKLIKENEFLILEKINSNVIIKKTSQFLNIQQESKSYILMIIIPFILIFSFITIKIIFNNKK